MNSIPGPIPTAPPSTIGYHGAVSDFKRRLIEATLHQARGNRTHAANILGISIRTLRNKLKEYSDAGVSVPPPQSAASAA